MAVGAASPSLSATQGEKTTRLLRARRDETNDRAAAIGLGGGESGKQCAPSSSMHSPQ